MKTETQNDLTAKNDFTVIRMQDVLSYTGLSRTTLYRFIARGEFPHPINLGERAIGWFKGDIIDWLEAKRR